MNKDYDIDRINFDKIKTYPIKERQNKATMGKMAKPTEKGISLHDFVESLPDYLKAIDLIEVADRIAKAHQQSQGVILGMGAHPIKVGLGPLIIDLLDRGILTGVLLNGAGVIHDFEMAYQGGTSEDVAEGLKDGSFGMADETGAFIHKALKRREGFGYSVGKAIDEHDLKHKRYSILWNAYRKRIPVCVSVAIGNDIIHQHPSMSGDDVGYNSYEDFQLFASLLPTLNDGGVFINLGSAVIVPETFLKALTVARNVKGKVDGFYTANFDMIQHYRPRVNVVSRPTMSSGKGYSITGHHEIMFPLLYAMVMDRL
jgi:deoxyhypusine synthase